MLNYLLIFLTVLQYTLIIGGSTLRGPGMQFQYHPHQPYNVLFSNHVKLGVVDNLMVITCDEGRTLAQLPSFFTTPNVLNHLKFIDCFRNKTNLINNTEHNNNEFNLNQFIIRYDLKINAAQLTVEFNEMSEISVNSFFDNFEFSSFRELRLINVNFLNQTLLGLFSTPTKLYLCNNYQINLKYFCTDNSVEFLTVRNNIIKSFSLDRFKNLLFLELVDCDINFNEFNIRNFFEMNKRLVSLHMKRNFNSNERIELSENIFNGLSKLKFLKFTSENLYDLPVGIFRNLASLIQLNLAHNRLEYLPKEIFFNNDLLEGIDLSHNNLKEISDTHFAKTPYLMHITLSNNQLGTIKYNASLQNSIQVIDLSHNNIEFNNLSECPIITAPAQYLQINLAYNKIRHIRPIECLINDHSVQMLNMSGNLLTEFNLTHLASKVIQHKLMAKLILTNNQIKKVDLLETYDWDNHEVLHAFSNLIVDLDENPVLCDNCTMLKNMFTENYFNVEYKDMVVRFSHPHYCKVTSFCDVQQYHQFVYHCPTGCSCSYNEFVLNFRVNCSNSNLTEVPQIPYPSFLFNAIELILDNNFIEHFTLDQQYYDVSIKITKISVRNNSLLQFILPFDKYPLHLVELNLEQNNLTSFNNGTLSILNIAQSNLNVTLGANQFCDNQTYYEYFLQNYQFNLLDDISCHNEVETLMISSYKAAKISISTSAIVMITVMSILIVIGVIGALLFLKTRRKDIFIRSTFVNHKRLNEASGDLGEGLLGEDEI